jgi:hypothetical protein
MFYDVRPRFFFLLEIRQRALSDGENPVNGKRFDFLLSGLLARVSSKEKLFSPTSRGGGKRSQTKEHENVEARRMKTGKKSIKFSSIALWLNIAFEKNVKSTSQ